jgi:UDP-N-acetylglucosamine 2-epimerase (non-hydrolysing)
MNRSRLIITDSGGIQEETTYLGIPCLTLRENTERPVTINQGTNRLCNLDNIGRFANSMLEKTYPRRPVPELWDGKTAGRVVKDIEMFLGVGK